MTIQKIIPKSEKSLRPTSHVTDFTDRYIRQAIQDLLDTLKEKQRSLDVIYPDAGCGVGLASNQIEYPYEPISDTDASPKAGYYPKDFTPPNIYVVSIRPVRAMLEACEVVEPSVYINATFHVDPLNNSKSVYEEGCLSVNGFTGVNIPRYEHLIIDAYNESGIRRQFPVSGFIARVHQHEMDHGLGMEYLNHLNFTHDELRIILRWIENTVAKDFSELSEWIIPNKLKYTSTELDLEALRTWTSHQILKMNVAAASMQGLFATYHLKKQATKQEAIATSPYSKLLQAFDLRFQCMRAVAAAKFPINKPIEDAAQVTRVIASIRKLAEEKGITTLDAVEQLFYQNIVLAERIQTPYYHMIWRKSYQAGVDNQRLIDSAYKQLRGIVQIFNIPVTVDNEKTCFESSDVLSLARELIQFASKMIIDALSEAEPFSNAVLQEEFSDAFEKMLAVYMTPGCLSKSKDSIEQMTQNINYCATC